MNNNLNLDKFLDDKIKSGLINITSESFSGEIMKRIELSRKFEKEDKKTSVFAYVLSSVLAFATIILLFEFIGSYFQRTEEGNLQFTVTLTNLFQKFSALTTGVLDTFGISSPVGSLLFFILIPLVIFAIFYIDKLLFKKKT